MSPTTTLTAHEATTQGWPTKAEAAQALNVSTKTVEKYVQAGKLIQQLQSRINKPPCAVIDPDSITKLMETKTSEQGRELAKNSSQNLSQNYQSLSQNYTENQPQSSENASQSLIASILQPLLAELREGVREGFLIGFENHSWPLPTYLSIKGAMRLTGLDAKRIQDAAREGRVPKVGRKYRREELEKL